MKKILFAALIFGIGSYSFGQVTNNFESGNRAVDKSNCWQFSSTDVTSSSAIEGNFNNQSGILNGGVHYLISPWVKFSKPGTMSFFHRMNANNGDARLLEVTLMDEDDQVVQTLYTFDYRGDKSMLIEADVVLNVTGIYRIKWEFTGEGGSSRGLLDVVYIPGTYYSDPTDNNGSGNCGILTYSPDGDGDGVADIEDDYPSDATRAYDNPYPGSGWNSLGFEDLWPSRGDYDFNDLVIEYQYNVVTDARNEIVEIKANFLPKAIGASFHSAFGFSLTGVPAASVIRVVNSQPNANGYGYFNINNKGLEAGQTWATVILFDDAYRVLPYPGSGMGVNTTLGAPYVEPKQISVTITLKENGQALGNAVNFTSWNQNSFNYFIVVRANEGRGIEVHLPDYPPTDLADRSLFGQADDNSDPAGSSTYRSKSNLPWVINVVASFSYPIEKADIIKTHLKFGTWAESGGQNFRDWYKDLEGYSNRELKYRR